MAEKINKNKNRSVDDAGIRLAPSPIDNAAYHVMPTVMQQYVIEPTIVTKETPDSDSARIVSTQDDFQPKREEVNKKWKRGKRAKNMASGVIALVASALVLLPYILGVIGAQVDAPFVLVPDKFNVIRNLISAFEQTAALGWKGEEVGAIWINTIPSLILTIGILCVLINVIKSCFAIFGAVKPIKFVKGAVIYALCLIAIFVASLVGASAIGIERIDFVADFIFGFAQSELFTLVVSGAAYLVLCVVGAIINRDKCGYLK